MVAITGCAEEPVERVVDLVVPVTILPVGTDTMESAVHSTGTLRPLREAELIAEIRGNLYYEQLAAGRPAEGVRVAEGEQVALENATRGRVRRPVEGELERRRW